MAIAATGFFDGVHCGHHAVLNRLIEISKQSGQKSEVITFWPHPRIVLNQDADKLRLLTSMSEKEALLKRYGVDEIIVMPFTKELSNLTTREFLQYIHEQYDVNVLIVGYDHRLGCDGGSVDLAQACREVGIEAIRVEKYASGQGSVSSTSIRKSLADGDVRRTANLLGYEYSLTGIVVEGNKIGRTIGFPTANMTISEPLKMIPSNGVYHVDVLYDGVHYKGVCNIGFRPTVYDNGIHTVETHILGFDEEIYGKEITVSFVSKIRDEMKFPSLDFLKEQIEKDKRIVEDYRCDI